MAGRARGARAGAQGVAMVAEVKLVIAGHLSLPRHSRPGLRSAMLPGPGGPIAAHCTGLQSVRPVSRCRAVRPAPPSHVTMARVESDRVGLGSSRAARVHILWLAWCRGVHFDTTSARLSPACIISTDNQQPDCMSTVMSLKPAPSILERMSVFEHIALPPSAPLRGAGEAAARGLRAPCTQGAGGYRQHVLTPACGLPTHGSHGVQPRQGNHRPTTLVHVPETEIKRLSLKKIISCPVELFVESSCYNLG